jgi:sec-independent protein translocase protein TatB
MFDLSSSKLFILGIVALIVIGPKDLPMLLRTVGKYLGMIRRQASEFRSQFDDAMRDSELEQVKKDVEKMSRDMETTMRDAETSVEREVAQANAELDSAIAKTPAIEPLPDSTFAGLHPTPPLSTLEPTPVAAPVAAPVKVGA